MNTRALMKTDLVSCRADDTLDEVVRRMSDGDCGVVLVTDPDGDELRGVITDRDVCMAAMTTGLPLAEIPVGTASESDPVTCSPDDPAAELHEKMRSRRVRRIPVVEGRRAVGIVSLNDLALAARTGEVGADALQEVATTLAAICQHRRPAGRT